MKFYNRKIFYQLMNFSLGREKIKRLRQELLFNATGEVLEIGFGTGLNVSCYPNLIHTITAIDVGQFEPCDIYPRIQIHLLIMSAEAMTFLASSFDTVVSTFTLCSIPNIHGALSESKRVLKQNGKFLFLEHGESPNTFISGVQNLVNPLYNRFADECNVNRDILQLVSNSGLDIQSTQTMGSAYRIAGFYISGIANKKGVPIYECGMLNLAKQLGYLGLFPQVCRMDYLFSHYFNQSFKRSATLADGDRTAIVGIRDPASVNGRQKKHLLTVNSLTRLRLQLLNLYNAVCNNYVTIHPYNQDTRVFPVPIKMSRRFSPNSSLVMIWRHLDFKIIVIDLMVSTEVFISADENK